MNKNGKKCLRSGQAPIAYEEQQQISNVEPLMVVEEQQQQSAGSVETLNEVLDENVSNLNVKKSSTDVTYPSGREIFGNFEEVESDESYLNCERFYDDDSNVNNALNDKIETARTALENNTLKLPKKSNPEISETLTLEIKLKSLQDKLEQCRKDLHNEKMRNTRLEKHLDKELKHKINTIEDFLKDKKLSDFSKALITLQFKKPRIAFSQNEKDLCKIMYFHSASNYNQMRKLGIKLAGPSTVRGWVAECDITTGLNDVILNKIKEKLEPLPPEEKLCALKFDELSIKSFEEYSKKFDEIEGFTDMGKNRRSPTTAKHALVFSLDSINAKNNWHQLLSFVYNENGTSASDLFDILKETLTALFKIGADVRMIVCDQGSNNQSLFNTFLNVTIDKPFFFHEEKKIFALYDWPHLIKRLLAQLRSHKCIYVYDGEKGDVKIIDFKDLIQTWQIDSEIGTSNILAFLSEKNFNPSNFDVMNVALAMKVLSRRMAKAIRTAGETHVLISDTWEQSAHFVETVDAVIDACNSYSLKNVEKQKRPLSDNNPEILKRIRDFKDWSRKWYTKTASTNEKTRITTIRNNRPPCFIGLPMTTSALEQLYLDIKKEIPLFELATGLCNQDSLEHANSKF